MAIVKVGQGQKVMYLI